MNNKLIIGVVVAVLVIGFIAFAFLNQDNNAPVKEFTMQSFVEQVNGTFYPQFSIKEIRVNEGDLVRIKVTNTAGNHDFKLDEFNVYSATPLNQEMTIEFIADKTGTFEYYCTMPGHRAMGHWGTLIVS